MCDSTHELFTPHPDMVDLNRNCRITFRRYQVWPSSRVEVTGGDRWFKLPSWHWRNPGVVARMKPRTMRSWLWLEPVTGGRRYRDCDWDDAPDTCPYLKTTTTFYWHHSGPLSKAFNTPSCLFVCTLAGSPLLRMCVHVCLCHVAYMHVVINKVCLFFFSSLYTKGSK